jgi:ribonuclease VapC
MFLDASALCAMITDEHDAASLSERLHSSQTRITSPLAIWETVTNVARIMSMEPDWAQGVVDQHLKRSRIEVIAVLPDMTTLALDAYRRYGKGRHPAGLNFGDCFAYACAKHHGVPLLYKGNDFSLTDIESA